MQSYSFLFLIERENGFATGVECVPVTVTIGEGLVVKLIKRAAAVIAALAVLAGGGVAAPSLASPDTSDGGETRAMERAASVPVGPNLTATWDATIKTLTVAGYGELNRRQWMDLKKQYCDKGGEAEPKRIAFSPNSNKQISFPSDSSSLFEGCDAAEIDLPSHGIDTSSVTNMQRMFFRAYMANPDVSNWDTKNVTTMRWMFLHSKKANPDVSRWNTSQVRDLSRMFEGAELANPDVSRWDTEQVTSTGRMFYNAVSADPDTSQWKLPNIDNIAWMFYGAVSVSYVDTTEWNLKRLRGPFDDPTFKKFQAAFRTFGKTTIRFEYKPFWDLDEFYFDNHDDRYGYSFFEFSEDAYSIYKEVEGKEVLAQVCRKNGNIASGWNAWDLLYYLCPPNPPDDAILVIRPKPFVAASANPIFINVGDPLPPLTYRTNPGSDRSKIQGELATTYKPGDPPGEYPITQGTLGLTAENASKYGFRFTPAAVVVKGLQGNPPPAQVTYSDWVDGAKDCNSRKVSQSRIKTTTPYKWDSGKRQWVLDAGKASKTTENRQRDMNDGEHKACTPQPVDKVTEGDWQDSTEQGSKDCNTRKAKETRTVTTTPYKWDSSLRKWVEDTGKATSRVETRERDMNERELGECINVALTISKDSLTVVKGQPVLQPLLVEATSTTDPGLISLQTVCAPKHDGQGETDRNALPAGVELIRVRQAPTGIELVSNAARTVGEVDGNATQAELGLYRCWVYATKPGVTIDPATGQASGPNGVEGLGWARKPLTVEVVQPALPKTGGAGMNRAAGLGALVIVGLTGGWWLTQTRRKRGWARA
ncbi:BspA family leucine-rich repeat surface protein [Actinotignum sp. UMB0459]|uniref:BspA family leucine-rich repeat surface protein n=1 Tax=Actinotignum sp. UMB0459 TaxID=3449314 RepID=UPI003F76290E